MPRKAKAQSTGAATAVAPAQEVQSQQPEAAAQERTFTAPSGKHYVIVQDNYPQDAHPELKDDMVAASEGDLMELLMTHMSVGYGKRFKAREGAVNEGVFQLSWVRGVRLVMEGGRRRPVEVDIHGSDFGFQQPRGTDAASKLRVKRYKKKMEDALKVWNKTDEGATLARQEAAAAKAAAALERAAEADEQARKSKAQQQRQQRRQQEQPEESQQRQQQSQPQQQDDQQQQQQPLSAQPRPQEHENEATSDPVPPAASSGVPEVAVAELMRQGGGSSGGEGQQTQAQQSWDSRWEQQAARLEALLSASSSGVEDTDGSDQGRPALHRKDTTRKFTRTLLSAKRSGELQAIAEEWEKAHSEMASKASDLKTLKEKVKQGLTTAHRADDIEVLIEEMANEAERKAAEVKELKERVFRAMLASKRSRKLERTTSDMDDAQKELEMKALQLKNLMKRAWKGMVESTRQGELERIADEMSEQFETKAESLRNKVRKGLLRAYRAGELQELRHELDELADSVPQETAAPAPAQARTDVFTPPRRRWSEYSSDSDTLGGAGPVRGGSLKQQRHHCQSSPAEADVSGSDAESIAGPGSPPRLPGLERDC